MTPLGVQPRVVAVLVTYDRAALLRRSVAAVLAQSRTPDVVVVVDNASTDTTPAVLAELGEQVDVLRLGRNLGGAGGFAAGLGRALDRHRADAVWMLDDDTVPEPGALAALVDTWSRTSAALVASRVQWTDGSDHPMNTPRPAPLAGRAARATAAGSGCVPIRSASFVSVLVDAGAVRQVGLPVADYFLWNDDFEFTTRLLRGRTGLLCPASVVVHHTARRGASDDDPGERFYLEVRNKTWLFTRSAGLAPLEKALYAGSTVRRWVRTVRGASDRPLVLRGLRHGLRDGLRTGPRSNDDVLASAR